jgi:hypothetical protein
MAVLVKNVELCNARTRGRVLIVEMGSGVVRGSGFLYLLLFLLCFLGLSK